MVWREGRESTREGERGTERERRRGYAGRERERERQCLHCPDRMGNSTSVLKTPIFIWPTLPGSNPKAPNFPAV
jgi:hypothetical protein